MSKRNGKESRLVRCVKAPIRVLRKTRDLYTKSMARCGGEASVGNSVFPASSRYQSETTKRKDNDLRDLTVASFREKLQPADPQKRVLKDGRVLSRSLSVVVGRIDENEPCKFMDGKKIESDLMLLRSKSLAVELRRRGPYARGAN